LEESSTTYQERIAREYIEYVKSQEFDVSTERNKAVFYSGDEGANRRKANEKYTANGFSTIETTEGGKWLERDSLYSTLNKTTADKVWDEAAKKYAQSASGVVTCVIEGTSPNSTFARVELPELLTNEKVTHINGIERKELQSLYGEPQSEQERLHALDAVYERIKKEPLAIGWDGSKEQVQTTAYPFQHEGKMYEVSFMGEDHKQQMENFRAELEAAKAQTHEQSQQQIEQQKPTYKQEY
jgi:hypothetical protein